MISAKNRVQEIKSKFENLNSEPIQKRVENQLSKTKNVFATNYGKENSEIDFELSFKQDNNGNESEVTDDWSPKPNSSYLYSKSEVKRSVSDTKNSLSRQISDPGKKLHRSHAFRCDKSQKIVTTPKRHGSCNGRSETSDFSFKMERKLSKDRLKRLGNFLEVQMKKENFVPQTEYAEIVGQVGEVESQFDSIPDSEVPQHILDQYATIVKPKRKEAEKQEAMTDSGVSSETENVEEDKSGRIKRLMSQFEKSPEKTHLTNLQAMDDLCDSSETIRLERKNPHLKLTDTLKKALKQPLPAGPPPAKPPRIFKVSTIPENTEEQKKEAKRMLEKLEKVLQKREGTVDTPKKPKEIHYLCTEILDITNRTLLPNQSHDPISRCLNSFNCAITNNSTSSLPYTRLKAEEESNTCCACTSENMDPHLSDNQKCIKCNINANKDNQFKCHLNCECEVKNSMFYVESEEHIYDVPYMDEDVNFVRQNTYGTLNILKNSKSMEELRMKEEADQIYDIPYDRPSTPDLPLSAPETPQSSPETTTMLPKSEFAKLRQNFENGFPNSEVKKPVPIKPKPILISKKHAQSIESLNGEFLKQQAKYHTTDHRRRNKCESGISFTLPKRDTQLDLDKENLNDLMNELFETVTAVCNMDDNNKPSSFPTEHSDGSTSEESVKLTRSLTEKRKNYVRRVSTRVAYLDPKNIKRFRHQTSVCSYKSEVLDNPYSTFRSWKSFRTSQGNITKMDTDSKFNLTDSHGNVLSMKDVLDASSDSFDAQSIDEKAGCIELPFEPRERGLFNLCLLVGLNHMTGQAYVKTVFPSQVQVPPHIENLVFPETMSSSPRSEWSVDARSLQCYSLVLTDERGERAYGYCRRVLPEGATTCLPLCYCLIGRYRAPGFYYKVLEEIESHHGSSDIEIHSLLQQLFETDFPNPGEEITIQYSKNHHHDYDIPNGDYDRSGDYCLPGGDYEVSPKSKTMPDLRRETSNESAVHNYYDLENNNNAVKNIVVGFDMPRQKIIKRPIEPRVDEDNVSVLLDLLGAGLVIKVFSSLLLERKVIIIGDQLKSVSSCVEALQSSLYPFVWQQPLISSIPSEIQREVLEAPLPILAGMLHTPHDGDITGVVFEEGMLIDLSHPSKVLFYQGDESTILPTPCYKTLKTALQMETSKNKDRTDDNKTRNVMISEAFLRFFVDILGDFWRFFSVGEVKDGCLGRDGVVFDKDAFIKSTTSKQNQYFLEWFTETAMFTQFIQNMAASYHHHLSPDSPLRPAELVDTPLPNFYELFDERVRSRSKTGSKHVDSAKNNYKNAVNKKVRFLKNKLRELVA